MLTLIQHANTLVTMDAQRRKITDAAILVEGREIISVGTTEEVEKWMLSNNRQAERVLDASGTVILPGLVNCHHHLYQTLTRSIGTAEGLSLFDWLETPYPIWGHLRAQPINLRFEA
jgi:cytosine/adenosine deaminase-related metal-dependent hydrolase